ncbi:hypothetical protein [Flavivirga jejuensis]|uniref:Transposase n=1 Tax=Flavivirga jejuensis TaxID=870487 RepID=A0ABT8WK51_9FLAO|nr:hypothetical protein [Flavivirga jejuensis]MDO5973520.1 hypothetical protein [Flavivirga jejuensis]
MNQKDLIGKLNRLEDEARRMLDTIVVLKEELSGGSDSSNLKSPVFLQKHKEELIKSSKNRRGIPDK